MAFQGCWCKESAVEEGDFAELSGDAGAFASGCIEGAEEECSEEFLVDIAAGLERPDCVVYEEVALFIEPAFGFEESQEEEPGGAEHGEFPVLPGCDGLVFGGASVLLCVCGGCK